MKIMEDCIAGLKKLLGIPEEYAVFFLSSGTECMEMAIENTVEKNSYHFVNGAFSKRFFETAADLRRQAVKCEAPFGAGFDFANAGIPAETELICFTHNETSTGVALDPADMERVALNNPGKLVAIDIVSSAPYMRIDYGKADMVFFSVQKGFGLPAGLGVMAVSPRAITKSNALAENSPQTYHSFKDLLKYGKQFQTPETPNVLSIYLLGKVIRDMLKVGIEEIRGETEQKAQMLYDFFRSSKKYSLFVTDPTLQSKTVLAINTAGGSAGIRDALQKKGLVVGPGYKEFKEKQIRIANFPAHSKEQILKLLQALE